MKEEPPPSGNSSIACLFVCLFVYSFGHGSAVGYRQFRLVETPLSSAGRGLLFTSYSLRRCLRRN